MACCSIMRGGHLSRHNFYDNVQSQGERTNLNQKVDLEIAKGNKEEMKKFRCRLTTDQFFLFFST